MNFKLVTVLSFSLLIWAQGCPAKERKQETYYDAGGRPLMRISFYVDGHKVLDGPYEDITPSRIYIDEYQDGKVVKQEGKEPTQEAKKPKQESNKEIKQKAKKENKQETYCDALGKPLKLVSYYVDESERKVLNGPYKEIDRSSIITTEYRDGKVLSIEHHSSVINF
jgi:hypothetical protein